MVMQLGEIRSSMAEDLLTRKLDEIARNAHKDRNLDEFWIVISHKFDKILTNIIREAIVVTNIRPQKLVNSMCFHVIWSQGLMEPEWILPFDSIYDGLYESEGQSALVYNSAKDIII